jgi:hypothetical protein
LLRTRLACLKAARVNQQSQNIFVKIVALPRHPCSGMRTGAILQSEQMHSSHFLFGLAGMLAYRSFPALFANPSVCGAGKSAHHIAVFAFISSKNTFSKY